MKAQLSVILLLLVCVTKAQPNTEVYLFDVDLSSSEISNPVNISNNKGYDNQPSFWPDGKSVLYSRTVNDQTEIARYDIESGNTVIITNTFQGSEYSPTPTPDGRISSIRLDTTGLQLLYSYDTEGNEKVLVPELVIGYHAWINDEYIVAFVLGEPQTMQIINVMDGTSTTVRENIGRSLHKIPTTRDFSFLDKSVEPWTIMSMDYNGETEILVKALENSEDYCWTRDGKIIMGQGSKLFIWEKGSEWKEIADLATYQLGDISRVAVSPTSDKLVVTVSE